MSIKTKTAQTIAAQRLISSKDTVIAAVSGGADSVAMFHLLCGFSQEMGFRLLAAHVNHGLRGAAADADEAFVRQLCEKAAVPLFVCRADLAAKGKLSENDAREARYAFFEQLAAEHGAKVATAHTLTDNAETVLLRLARGCSLAGAGGIPVKRGVFIRPLLFCTRAEVEQYCRAEALPFVTDETNAGLQYARNRVRHKIAPELSRINARAAENLALFAQDAAETAQYLEQQACALLTAARTDAGTDAAKLRRAPLPVRKAAFCQLMEPFCTPDRAKVEACAKALTGAKKAQLARGLNVFAAVRQGSFVIYREDAGQPIGELSPELRAYAEFPDHGFELLVLPVDQMIKNCKQNKKELKNYADYGMIKNKLEKGGVLRTRRARDHFRPAGRGVGKTLKKLFIEDGVPLPERDRLPVLACGSEILWAWGYGFAEEYVPKSQTGQVLLVKMEHRISGGK